MQKAIFVSLALIALLSFVRFSPGESSSSTTNSNSTNTPDVVTFLIKLEIKDDKGHPLPLLSAQAYRAEFRYLRKTYHQIDLKGPPVETDGWTYNIPEAEWPFMGVAYFGYACCNLVK